MFDYGWRQYMPDLGRWNGIDQLAEAYSSTSTYAYVANNPISNTDPDGRWINEDGSIRPSTTFDYMPGSYKPMYSFSMSTGMSYNSAGGGGGSITGDPTPKSNKGPGVIERFISWLFGGKKGAGISTFAPGATIRRIPIVEVGEPIRIGEFFSTVSAASVAVGAATLGAVLTPVMMKDPEYNWTRDLPLTVPVTTTADEPDPGEMITLYRGVSSKAKGSMYFEASQGIAIPNGYRQVAATWGPHSDMEAHAGGDNLSIWTSWSTSKESARDFATGVAMYENGIPGIIISKQFKVGTVLPNPYNPQEAEWLVPGVVYGAKVEYVLPR